MPACATLFVLRLPFSPYENNARIHNGYVAAIYHWYSYANNSVAQRRRLPRPPTSQATARQHAGHFNANVEFLKPTKNEAANKRITKKSATQSYCLLHSMIGYNYCQCLSVCMTLKACPHLFPKQETVSGNM